MSQSLFGDLCDENQNGPIHKETCRADRCSADRTLCCVSGVFNTIRKPVRWKFGVARFYECPRGSALSTAACERARCRISRRFRGNSLAAIAAFGRPAGSTDRWAVAGTHFDQSVLHGRFSSRRLNGQQQSSNRNNRIRDHCDFGNGSTSACRRSRRRGNSEPALFQFPRNLRDHRRWSGSAAWRGDDLRTARQSD